MAVAPYNNYKFDLTVHNIQFNDARMLNRIIVGVVEAFGATAGGGFHQVADTSEIFEVHDDLNAETLEALQAKIDAIKKSYADVLYASAEAKAWDDGYINGLQFAINVLKGEVTDVTQS